MIEIKDRVRPERVLFASQSGTIREALAEAVVARVDLRGANLTGADLSMAYLRGANLSEVRLDDVDLQLADLTGADLRWADLRGANLGGAHLTRADLRGANLRGAQLRDTDLRWANLGRVNLRGVDLRWAYLYRADLGETNLRETKINWQSHDVIAEILRRHAGEDAEQRKLAGLVLVSRDWCWSDFLALESPLRDWALDTLAAYVVENDDAPDELVARKATLFGIGAAPESTEE